MGFGPNPTEHTDDTKHTKGDRETEGAPPHGSKRAPGIPRPKVTN